MKDNKKRWKILDGLLGAQVPVSSEEIFKTWAQESIAPRYDSRDKSLQEQYSLTLRQDLCKFEQIYKNAGFDNPLLKRIKSEKDERKRSYQYAEKGFSIMPYIAEKYTKAHWKSIDDSLSQLFQNLPERLAAKINFMVNSRIDIFRDSEIFVEWPDNPQLRGYDLLPELYGYVKRRQPLQIGFAMFDSSDEAFIFHPYLLKEYNGRWYCLGYREDKKMLWPISVDRIKPGSVRPIDKVCFVEFHSESCDAASKYFSNVIGVTKEYNEESARDFYVSDKEYDIVLKVTSRREWMYLITNPIHSSQKELSDYDEKKQEGRIMIRVICNIEMYNTILSWGRHVQIEKPFFAREIIKSMVKDMAALYED